MRKISRRLRPLLGTYVEVGVERDASGGRREVEEAISHAFEAIDEVQRRLSFHDPQSDLSRLNRAAGEEVEMHPLSARVLGLARGMTHGSQGAFNCTVGGKLVRIGALPDLDGRCSLDSTLECGSAEDIEIRGRKARLARPVRVTLDGIAKGFAVDLAVRALRRNGIVSGWVNAGGDLRVFGDAVLPVERREESGNLVPLGNLRQAALASSWVKGTPDSRFPGWIVGTEGSRAIPVRTGIYSVIARSAWRADALTKVASSTLDSERASRVRALGGLLV